MRSAMTARPHPAQRCGKNMMRTQVVRRWIRAVVAKIPPSHRRIAGKPAGVVVRAGEAAGVMTLWFAVGGQAVAATARRDFVHVCGNIGHHPVHKIPAWMRHWNGGGAIGHQAAIGGCIGVDAQQGKRLGGRRRSVPRLRCGLRLPPTFCPCSAPRANLAARVCRCSKTVAVDVHARLHVDDACSVGAVVGDDNMMSA